MPRQSKAAKLAFLKRSAAGKAKFHRIRHRKLAIRHGAAAALLLIFSLSWGGMVAAMSVNLIPPPSPSIDMDAYIRGANERRAAQRAAISEAAAQATFEQLRRDQGNRDP